MEPDVCPICLVELNDDEIIEIECGHRQHETCFVNYIDFEVLTKENINLRCPICKNEICSEIIESMSNRSSMQQFHRPFHILQVQSHIQPQLQTQVPSSTSTATNVTTQPSSNNNILLKLMYIYMTIFFFGIFVLLIVYFKSH